MKKFNIQFNGGDTITVETASAREAVIVSQENKVKN